MKVNCVWEHNGNDTLLYAVDYIGAYTRAKSLDEAVEKMPDEIASYLKWCKKRTYGSIEIVILEEKDSSLCIRDADSDVIFASERLPLTKTEYERLKALALRSAQDFLLLYEAISEKDKSTAPQRKTFYGTAPRTAREMYIHTKSVNEYYFAEINVKADNEGDIYECRRRGFEALEKIPDFLQSSVIEGSYGELWSLRKLLRRFIWHDRIHAKAMYRLALKQGNPIANPFFF